MIARKLIPFFLFVLPLTASATSVTTIQIHNGFKIPLGVQAGAQALYAHKGSFNYFVFDFDCADCGMELTLTEGAVNSVSIKGTARGALHPTSQYHHKSGVLPDGMYSFDVQYIDDVVAISHPPDSPDGILREFIVSSPNPADFVELTNPYGQALTFYPAGIGAFMFRLVQYTPEFAAGLGYEFEGWAAAGNNVYCNDVRILFNFRGTEVPEPISLSLLGVGIAGIGLLGQKRRA